MLMRRLRNLLCLPIWVLVSLLPALAWEREPLPVYHERRVRLVRETDGDGVIVLFGYKDADVAASVTTFHQNENFYYLTGWNEPNAMMLLIPKAAKAGAAPELGPQTDHHRDSAPWFAACDDPCE